MIALKKVKVIKDNTSCALNYLTVSAWSLALGVGIGLGWWQVSRCSLRVNKATGQIQIPGTWSTLVIILLMFAAKYYFSYQLAVAPQRIHELGFEV